jgi:hypothetical protein
MKLSASHFALIIAGGLLIAVFVGVALLPSLHVRYIEAVAIQRFEADYGFRAGPVRVHRAGSSETVFGIVWVDPSGKFAKSGVRSGDVPFEYHGGSREMYYALEQASTGEASAFEVYNAAEADRGRPALRRVNLPAR